MAIVPPPPPQGLAQQYYVQSSSGNVFGPLAQAAIEQMLSQNKLQGSEQVSLDGQQWMPMSAVAAFAPYASGTPAPQINASAPQMSLAPVAGAATDDTELPGLPGVAPPELAELPGLPTAAPQSPATPALAAPPVAPAAPELADLPGLPPPPGTPPPPAGISLQAAASTAEAELPGLPGLERTAPPAGPAAAVAPVEEDIGLDLPGLPGAAAEVVDVPGLPSAAPAEGALGPSAIPLDLAELDSSTPAGLVDLPAPAVPTQMPPAMAATQLAQPRPVAPSVAAPGSPPLGLTDLPAPAGADTGSTLIGLAPPGGASGLPSPVGAAELPIPAGSPGIGGLGNLPPASPGVTDLPSPAPGLTDLPSPAAGLTDLPSPAPGLTDLPSPSAGLEGLPSPAAGLTDLPSPATANAGLPAPSVAGLPSPAAELPSPAAGVGLPMPAPGLDLPAPGAPGLPQPAAGQGSSLVDFAAGLNDYDAVSFSAEAPAAKLNELPLPAAAAPIPTGDQTALIEDTVPIPDDDDEALLGFDAQPSQLTAQPEPVVGGRMQAAVAWLRMRKGIVIAAASAGGLVFLGGIALGLLTDYGFFGTNLLKGERAETPSATARPVLSAADAMKAARKALLSGKLAGYRSAVSSLQAAVRDAPGNPELKALLAQALTVSALHGGGGTAGAKKLIQELGASKIPDVKKTQGLLLLAAHKGPEALKVLQPISDADASDALAALYAGWAALAAKQPAVARTLFARAEKISPKLVAAAYGLALTEEAAAKLDAALEAANEGLKLAPKHPGMLLLRARLSQDLNPAIAEKSWKIVLGLKDGATKKQLAEAQISLANLAADQGRNDDARELFKQALEADPNSGAANLGLGRLLYVAGHYKDAMPFFEKANKSLPTKAAAMKARTQLALRRVLDARATLKALQAKAPRNAELRFLLGQTEEKHDAKAAMAHYRASIDLKADYFEPYRRLSQLYLEQGKVSDAFATLEQAQAALRGSAEVRNAMGEAYAATKKYVRAQKLFEEALALKPELNVALFNLATCLREQGKSAEALERFKQLQQRDAQYRGLAAAMGATLAKVGDFRAAAAAYDEALKVEDPLPEVRLGAARAYTLAEQYKKSLQQSERVLREHPTMAEARALRAEARLGQGQHGEALVEVNQALGREKRASFYEIQARVFEALKRFAEAGDSYAEAVKLDRSRADLRLRRGKLLVRGGAVKDGLEELQQVVRDDPKQAEAFLYIGIAHSDLGREKAAARAFKKAAEIDPMLAEAHWRLGQLHSDHRRMAEAVSSLEQAVKHAPENARWRAQAYYLLGSAAAKRGQKDRAVAAYRAYLDMAPGNDAARPTAVRALAQLGVQEASK